MNVTILGSTGFVGKYLLKKAIAAKYHVKVLVRNPEKLECYANEVEVIKGDYFNPVDVKKALKGSDVVLSTIGAPSKNSPDINEYLNALKNTINVMNEFNIKRFIIIGGAATPNADNEKFDFNRKLLAFFVNRMGKHLIKIKKAEYQILLDSGLDWTVIRPPLIVNEISKKSLFVHENKLKSIKVTVEDLTDFMLQQIISKEWIKKTPILSI